MLYHCGICFAKRDISPGEELTFDYRYIMSQNDIFSFIDKETGQKIDGYSPEEALRKSTQELMKLLGE